VLQALVVKIGHGYHRHPDFIAAYNFRPYGGIMDYRHIPVFICATGLVIKDQHRYIAGSGASQKRVHNHLPGIARSINYRRDAP